jgi:NAD(P)-dependent dehydrogenase (short-subunit alcohol dehydrogenase family)
MPILENKTILVAGGTGEVGEGIVRQLLRAGANVIVPGRSADKLAQLRSRLEPDAKAEADNAATATATAAAAAAAAVSRLTTITAPNFATPQAAERVKTEIINRFNGLDGVVASLGGWWQGQSITEVSPQLWHDLFDQGLNAHFIVARTFLPLLYQRAGGSSYTLINGGGALQAIAGAGPVVISAAAQLRLGEVLAAEAARSGLPTRINNLVLATPVLTRSRPNGPTDWLSADDAGRYAVFLASDKASSLNGQTIIFNRPDQLDALGDF